jgi:hypothetical protein
LQFKSVRSEAQGEASGHVVPHIIPPGGEAKLHVRAYLGPPRARTRRELVVTTNDPVNPQVKVTLEGSSRSRVKLDPPRLDLGPIPGSESARKLLEVTMPEGMPLKIVGTRTSSETISAEVEEIAPGSRYRVEVSVCPPPAGAPMHGWVHLLTDHSHGYQVIGIPITARLETKPTTAPQ